MMRFDFVAKLIGIEKTNNEWANLLFEGKDVPPKVSIHRDCVENNRDILVACKKLPDKYYIHVTGKMYWRRNRWLFSASGLFEATPNPDYFTEDDLQKEIDSWFEESKKMSLTEQARKKGILPKEEK